MFNAIKKNIPNAITSLNLLCGCIAITFIFHNKPVDASWMVIFAGVADFFDGLAARLLKVSSPIGKDLDSLADMVSFGVVPGMMMYQMINDSMLQWTGLLIPIFAAIRLAKFNNDTRQTIYFIGVPTPAIALFIASFPLILSTSEYWGAFYTSHMTAWFIDWSLVAVAVICSALMVLPFRLLSMKIKGMAWGDNKARYVLVVLSLASIILFQFVAVPIIFVLYLVLSLVANPAEAAHE